MTINRTKGIKRNVLPSFYYSPQEKGLLTQSTEMPLNNIQNMPCIRQENN